MCEKSSEKSRYRSDLGQLHEYSRFYQYVFCIMRLLEYLPAIKFCCKTSDKFLSISCRVQYKIINFMKVEFIAANLHFILGYSLLKCKDDYVGSAQLDQQRVDEDCFRLSRIRLNLNIFTYMHKYIQELTIYRFLINKITSQYHGIVVLSIDNLPSYSSKPCMNG